MTIFTLRSENHLPSGTMRTFYFATVKSWVVVLEKLKNSSYPELLNESDNSETQKLQHGDLEAMH